SDATAGDLVPKGGGPASAASGEAMIDRAAFARSGEGPHPSSQGPSRGYFKVMTNPPFARVLVDGKELGTTPMPSEIALPEGAHLLEVLRAGCKPVQKEIQISEWDTTFLRITLDRLE
ncbi:MAG: hypothetical protein JWP91_2754, partial [Fibrobacteres bacterium]|nr:hypothetical protein [Fibrobacterota bacterium]